jgi:glyoxylase-like metal-dependent hydrolase (beta-lactamase superfamily II)
MKRFVVVGSIVVAGACAIGLHAQQPAAEGPKAADIEKIRDNLYMITPKGGGGAVPGAAGGGGNTAVFITTGGVVLVDTKYPDWGPVILEKVKSVTSKPVTHIINTHTHGDHVGSNMFFPASVEIVAQEQTAANMARMDNFKDPGDKHGLPDRTFKDKLTLLSGKDTVDLYYFGRAHTNGDAFVVFRDLRVMHAGDVFARKGTPLIDTNNGASGVDYPETIRKAVAGIANVDTVIPGHSTLMRWAEFVEFGEFNAAFLSAVRAAKKAGKTEAQATAELVLPPKFKDYAMTATKDNVSKIWSELK